MSNCTSGCKTQDHESYGACLRQKNLGVTGLESTNHAFSRNREKAWDAELDRYEAAVRQGIQPASTRTEHIDAAVEVSQQLGTAFSADAPPTVVSEGGVE